MKFSAPRAALVQAVDIVSSIVPARTPKEILKNIKIAVKDGKAVLTATDQDVGIRYELTGIDAARPGTALLPARRTVTILHELTDDPVEIETTDDAVWIRTAHSEFHLPTEDPSGFPDVPTFAGETRLVVPGKTLREQIRKTVFATDTESTRYALGGVLLDAQGEQLVLAATDSRRLAVATTGCSWTGTAGFENRLPVVPAKAMSLIDRSVPEEGDVQVVVRTNEVLVQSGPATIYGRLVEGRFPRYKDVIPDKFKFSVTLPSGPFLSVVRQAQIVTNEDSRGVDFAFESGQLVLSSSAADIGQSKVQLPVAYDGEPFVIRFDVRFVADFLRVVDAAGTVQLDLIDPDSAAVFRGDDAYVYVIMPLARDRT